MTFCLWISIIQMRFFCSFLIEVVVNLYRQFVMLQLPFLGLSLCLI